MENGGEREVNRWKMVVEGREIDAEWWWEGDKLIEKGNGMEINRLKKGGGREIN